jgi:hypothetical protein
MSSNSVRVAHTEAASSLLPRSRLVDQLKPVSAAYARYSPSATFHDPIGLAKGLEAVVSVLVPLTHLELTSAAEGAIQQFVRHCLLHLTHERR